MTTTTLQKVIMAFIILAAAWFALRYRQSNYEPPESTVTVTPPAPIVQPAQSGDQPASIAPAPEQPTAQAPLPPVPQVPEQPVPDQMTTGEDIGGIGAFNTIAGETMYDFDPSSSAPPPTEQAPPPPPTEQAPPPPPTTGTETYIPVPMDHSMNGGDDGEIEMYSRSGYAELL
jgi:hypothetical protein